MCCRYERPQATTDLSGSLIGNAVQSRGDHKACRESLEIPLPGSVKRLVKVIDVKYQVAFRRGKQAEIQEVTVPAGLHLDARDRSLGEIVCHQSRRSTQERKGVTEHASVTNRNQLPATAPGCKTRGSRLDRAGFRQPPKTRAWRAEHASRRALPAASLSLIEIEVIGSSADCSGRVAGLE